MILTCPECATSYFVDGARIPPEGRVVKCTSCTARWRAFPEADGERAGAADAEPGAVMSDALAAEAGGETDAAAGGDLGLDFKPPGEALPKAFRAKADMERRTREAATVGVIWAGMAAALLMILGAAVVFRVDVVRLWPRTAAAYAGVGLPVNSLGLAIEAVRAEPSLQDGHAALSVTGVIRNIENRQITAPPLKISLMNKAGRVLVTKIAKPADPRMPPGATRHFALAILDPPSTAEDLEVRFADAVAHSAAPTMAVGGHAAVARVQGVTLRPVAAEPPPIPLAGEATPAPVEAVPLPPGAPDALTPHG